TTVFISPVHLSSTRLITHFLFPLLFLSFFFTDPATPEIYTLSLHDALPIFRQSYRECRRRAPAMVIFDRECGAVIGAHYHRAARSEEHTSELQSLTNLVCRLLLEKKKTSNTRTRHTSNTHTTTTSVANIDNY